MVERPLMTPDELKSMPKGSFVLMKTGTHPVQTKLRLFLEWGITFEQPYEMPDRGKRPVAYADRDELVDAIRRRYTKAGAAQPARGVPRRDELDESKTSLRI
jgi:type IV secretion system protein VirD4